MRPEILFPLFASVSTLKGVGPKVAPLLERVAGPLVRDLLFTAPQGLIRRRHATVADAVEGEAQIFTVRVDAHLPPARSNFPYRIRVADETGFLFLSWFKVFGDHLARAHPVGATRIVSGEPSRYGVELSITHPDWLLPVERAGEAPEVEPVYPATAGLPARTVRRLALEAVARAPALPEWQDAAWLAQRGWSGWREAITRLHAPAWTISLRAACHWPRARGP